MKQTNDTNDPVDPKVTPKITGSTPFWINDWHIDPDTCRIQRGDEVVKLEPKVMTVLVCLAEEAGKVVSREQLETKAWPGMVVGYDSLASAIIKLRKAFGDDSKNPTIIETVSKKGYRLSDSQTQAILELRLQRLTGLEQDKIVGEYKEVMIKIADLLDVLAKTERITSIIADELAAVKKQFGDKRRSEIVVGTQDLSMEDLIAPEDVIVTLSHTGYIKSQPIEDYHAQKRGGRGKQATKTKEDDVIDNLFIVNTHDYILCFSSRGRAYWIKVYSVPQGGRTSRGKPIVNLLQLGEGERINAILPVREFDENRFIFMATSLGTVKKIALSKFSRPRVGGIIAVALDDGDYLIGVALTEGKHDVMLFSDGGKAMRFDENDVRPMGRSARGVRGMKLGKEQKVISLLVAENEELSVLTATENGYGKRTPISEYARHGRGTQGMISIRTSERNGKVVAARLVKQDDEIMLITTGGVLIRTRVKEVRKMNRATQGVRLVKLDEGEKLAGFERVIETDEE